MADALPPLIDPADLPGLLATRDDIVLVDLSNHENHAKYHIPGSVHLDYARIVRVAKPVMGLLPEPGELEQVLGAVGIGTDTPVIAFDDEGGGKAGRLLWTLDCMGHHQHALLDGGLVAWVNEGRAVDQSPTPPTPARFQAAPDPSPVADTDYILAHLSDPDVRLLDNRSPAEFSGEKRFAERGGHIPGAINWDWTEAMDQHRHLRLKPLDQLKATLADMGITADKQVICYCQTHHRSSLIYVLLKILGFGDVKGYPGAWSDWGNRTDTPVET